MSALRRTPLHALHARLGARLVEFAGFEMPLQYGSILAEHAAVREHAGLFDVSHMGQLHLRGRGAEALLERLVTCPVASLREGRVRYGMLCNAQGGVVDDVTLYRLGRESFFLCVNAANVERDLAWIRAQDPEAAGASLEDRSAETGLLALQGPASPDVLARVAGDAELARGLRRFGFRETKLGGHAALVSRTGYTGSDGFEIYLDGAEATVALFERLLEAGRDVGLVPAGLGARDTLRLEAALALHGHELDEKTTPLEAGLERFVKLEAGGFIGAEALAAQHRAGLQRRLVGFVLEERGVPRADHEILEGGRPVGRVTSGGPSPTLGRSIGLGYVPPRLAEVGRRLEIAIRSRAVAARVVETPFV